MTVALRTHCLTVALALSQLLSAQCAPQWQAGDPLPYVRGKVNATVTWDPDGAGPAPLLLVVGGSFAAGTLGPTSIATFDGSQWAALGTPPGEVTELIDWNGQLVAAVTTINSDFIVQWNGTTWQTVGITSGYVHALGVFQGELVVGGMLGDISSATSYAYVNNIARWNGSTWSALGSGVIGTVYALVVFIAIHGAHRIRVSRCGRRRTWTT